MKSHIFNPLGAKLSAEPHKPNRERERAEKLSRANISSWTPPLSARIRARFFPPSHASRVTSTLHIRPRVPSTQPLARVRASIRVGPAWQQQTCCFSACATCPTRALHTDRPSTRQPILMRHVAWFSSVPITLRHVSEAVINPDFFSSNYRISSPN